MKYITILTLLLICISCFGCISVQRYHMNAVFEPTYTEEIEIYSTGFPIKPYTEIAQIVLKSRITEKTINKLKEEAAKIGANAVIITGPAQKGGINGGLVKLISGAIGWSIGASLEEDIGWKAVAVKYND